MGDESGSLEGKSLSNLRVVDLKLELEKRGLSKSGSKKELIKRLKQKLELERMFEESTAIGESEPKLQLDEATEQNEFVKQYLAQQQTLYARQKEVRRLVELRKQEEEESGGTDDSDSGLKDQDSDVSEGVNLSKSTCDSSVVVEGENDDDDKETPAPQKESESEDTPVAAIDPVSSNQDNPCDSTNSPNQATHERAEPSNIPVEMESKSVDTVTFSLLDISLPESPKMPAKSGSKSPRSKSDKLPLKTTSHQADSLIHDQENVQTNGSVPKISKSGRWHEGPKTPSVEIDKISDSTDHVEQVSELPVPGERLDVKNLSKEIGAAVNDKEVGENVDSSRELETKTSVEDSKVATVEVVEKTNISSDREIENQESKFSVPKSLKSDPDQVMEISESNTSTGEPYVRIDNLENERDPIDVHKTKQGYDSDIEMVDISEMPDQPHSEKCEKLSSKTKMLKRRDRSSSSSGSSSSRNSSLDRKRNRSPKLKEKTGARHRGDTRQNRDLRWSRSPDPKQKDKGSRQKKGNPDASRSRSPDMRQKIRDIRRKRSPSPDTRRSKSPNVRHRDKDKKYKRGSGLSRSKSPDTRHKGRDAKWKRDPDIRRKRSPDAKHRDKDIRRQKRDSSASRSPDLKQKAKDVKPKEKKSGSWSKSPEIMKSKNSGVNRSRSPDVSRSKSPGISRNKSPEVSQSKSPGVSRSKSPGVSRSRSPGVSRSRSPGVSRSRSPDVSRSMSPDVSRSRSPDVSRSKSSDASRSKTPEIKQRRDSDTNRILKIGQSRSPDAKRRKHPEMKQSKSLEMSQSSNTKANETTSPVVKQILIHKKKQSISPKSQRSISPKERESTSPFIRRSSSPSFKLNVGSETKQSNRCKESISPERKQNTSPNRGQSINTQMKQSLSPGKSRNSSPEERPNSPEANRKRKVESRKSFLDNLSDSSSDSDHRESKRVVSIRNTVSQEKHLTIIEEGEYVHEKKAAPELRQPKRPKLNRSSFLMPETTIKNTNRKSKEVLSSDSNVTSTEGKSIAIREEMMTPKEEQPPVSAALFEPSDISSRKLNMPFKKQTRQDTDVESKKKRRWKSSNMLQNTGVNVSTDSLKHIMPGFKTTPTSVPSKEMEEVPMKIAKGSDVPAPKLLPENEEGMSSKDENNKDAEAPKVAKTKASKVTSKQKKAIKDLGLMDTPSCSSFSSALDAISSKKPVKKPTATTAVAPVSKEEPVKKETEKRKSSVPRVDLPLEPSKLVVKPTSCIVFVQNLVRPFTLNQLKTLLNQTGTIVEDGFWIDKIKSKCFVKYKNEEEATKTKEALHETRWPPSNPKILSVESATQEEFDLHSKGYDIPRPPVPVAPQPDIRKREGSHEPSDLRKRRAERHSRERERSRQNVTYVREWDKDKLTQESPEREPVRPPKESHRNRSSERKKDSKKGDSKKKPLEDTPAKLLDDLFQKTKNTPCIYWLPLTEEQVKIREDERRQRRLDREKRIKLEREEEAERRAKRKPREKENRSRSRSRQGRRR